MFETLESKALRQNGLIYQVSMIGLWLFRGIWFSPDESWLNIHRFVIAAGFALMVYPMLRIYIGNKKEGKLLTTDVFAYTRHPMYHGVFLADLGLFISKHNLVTPFFWVTWALFVALLLAAGYMQEKETLARWGKEAEEYYAKTPRFIFGWLYR